VDPTTPEGVQPDPGQGAGGDAPYAEYLNRIPEELRPQVEPIFRDWDGQTTRKFQEHSQFRQQWDPYQQVGLDQYDPQDLAGLIEFAKMANDPARQTDYLQWLQAEAAKHGLGQPSEEEDDFGDLLDPSVAGFVERATSPLAQKLQAMEQSLTQFQEQQAKQAQEAMWNQQFERLIGEHGELDRDLMQTFAAKYANDPQNAIHRGFEDFQRARAAIEQQVLRGKLNQPPSPSAQPGAGLPDARPKNLDEAERMMRERLEQMGSF